MPLWADSRMDRFALFGGTLTHLEVSSMTLSDLTWVRFVHNLQCLSLRGCQNLPPEALASLAELESLQALDLQVCMS